MRAPDWCPEQGSWPSVWVFFLAPDTRLVQMAGGGVGPSPVVHSFWAGQEPGAALPVLSHRTGARYPLPCPGEGHGFLANTIFLGFSSLLQRQQQILTQKWDRKLSQSVRY